MNPTTTNQDPEQKVYKAKNKKVFCEDGIAVMQKKKKGGVPSTEKEKREQEKSKEPSRGWNQKKGQWGS